MFVYTRHACINTLASSHLLMCVCVFCRHIAELIFYMEELRAHVRKYGPVMQRYYVQYLSGFDAVVLNELVQVGTFKKKKIQTPETKHSYCIQSHLI